MTYVVIESCIRCKYTDCVDVCPVDCFREGPDMLVIDPNTCIDCAVCEPACPIDAIKSDASPLGKPWVDLNSRYAGEWPALTMKQEPCSDASQFAEVKDKFLRFFRP